jgi:hypothetical protein
MDTIVSPESQKYYAKYYGDLVGATILSYDGMVEDEFGMYPFPTFTVRFKDGQKGQIQIYADEEGNGGGFISGLALP